MAAVRFPFRGSREAPLFDGTPLTLNRYFQDIDQLFDNLGVVAPTDAAKVAKATYYLDALTADLWESVIPVGGDITWTNFKAAIQSLYPGADRARLYSARDLDNTVHQYASQGVYTRADLGEYCRDFRRISNYLRNHNRIDEGACDRLFIQGFGDATRRRIESRLLFVMPDHHPDDPYPESNVRTAAEFLLSATSTAPTPSHAPVPQQAPVKPTPSTLDQLIQKVEALAVLVNSQQNQQKNPQHAPHASSPAAPGVSTDRCHFCGTPGCRIGRCPEVENQIKAGAVARSAEGKVTLPSGNYLPRNIAGRNLAEKFAQFHSDNPGHRAHTTASIQQVNMIDTVASLMHEQVYEEQDTIEDDAEESIDDLARVFATEAARRFDKTKKRTTNTSQKAAEVPPKPQAPKPADPAKQRPSLAWTPHFTLKPRAITWT